MKKNYLLIGSVILGTIVLGTWLYGKNEQAHQTTTTPIEMTEKITPPPAPVGSSTLGVFEGRTPCQDFLIAFTGSSVNSLLGCERIKWLITLYQDEQTGEPTRYIFGVHNREDSHEGSWRVTQGTPTDPEAVVYQLQSDDNRPTVSLLKVRDNHLFFLDRNMNLLVGNKLFSYTLSRTSDNYEN